MKTRYKNSSINIGKYHFIGIAISDYKHVSSLSNPVKDVEAVLAVLEAQYVFDKITVLKNEDATRAKINNLLDEYTGPGKIGENDALLIYFAGHGKMIRNRGYWVPYDANMKDASSFFSNAQIIDILQSINTRHVLLISDSCFSGSLIGVRSLASDATAKVLMQKKSRKIMTSGGQEEVSDGVGNSPFALALISELQNNPNNFLIADAIFPAIRDITCNINSEQTPAYAPIQGAGDLGGQFVFKRKESNGSKVELLSDDTLFTLNSQKNKHENAAWSIIKENPTKKALEVFINDHPVSNNLKLAKELIFEIDSKNAWIKIKSSQNIKSLTAFRYDFPRSKYDKNVIEKIKVIQRKKTFQINATIERAWLSAIQKNTKSAFLFF